MGMMSDKAFTLWLVSWVATFLGACAGFAAVIPSRPLPWTALVAAACAAVVVAIFGALIFDPTRRR